MEKFKILVFSSYNVQLFCTFFLKLLVNSFHQHYVWTLLLTFLVGVMSRGSFTSSLLYFPVLYVYTVTFLTCCNVLI
jgi:hypothetical protein